MVEALAAQGFDEPFHIGILPRGPRRDLHLLDPQGVHPAREYRPVDRIVVAQKVARASVPGERLHELLGCPLGRWGVGDADVDDAGPDAPPGLQSRARQISAFLGITLLSGAARRAKARAATREPRVTAAHLHGALSPPSLT